MPLDTRSDYTILGLPENSPTPLTKALIDEQERQSMISRRNDLFYQTNVKPSVPSDPANINTPQLNADLEKITDAANRLRKKVEKDNTKANNDARATAPENAADVNQAQQAHHENNKRAQELTQQAYSDKVHPDLAHQDGYVRSRLDRQGFENAAYLIYWLLLRNDGYQPITIKDVYDENGKKTQKLHFNWGARPSDLIEWRNTYGIDLPRYRFGGAAQVVDDFHRMGLLGDTDLAHPTSDVVQQELDKKGPAVADDMLKEYERAGDVTVTRDSSGAIQNVQWVNDAARKQAESRMQHFLDQVNAPPPLAPASAPTSTLSPPIPAGGP